MPHLVLSVSVQAFGLSYSSWVRSCVSTLFNLYTHWQFYLQPKSKDVDDKLLTKGLRCCNEDKRLKLKAVVCESIVVCFLWIIQHTVYMSTHLFSKRYVYHRDISECWLMKSSTQSIYSIQQNVLISEAFNWITWLDTFQLNWFNCGYSMRSLISCTGPHFFRVLSGKSHLHASQSVWEIQNWRLCYCDWWGNLRRNGGKIQTETQSECVRREWQGKREGGSSKVT